MTYRELLTEGVNHLCENKMTEYENNAWLLFEYTFDMPRHQYFMKMNEEISDDKSIDIYRAYIKKRAAFVPVQYITGRQDFMGMTFSVNENVLIPRQDTEVLVEKVLKLIENKKVAFQDKVMRVLDMCTGSGCIAISISKLGNVDVTAVDISEKALETAKSNATNLGADRVKFVKSNLFEKINMNNGVEQSQRYDIIVSNPPYIPSKVVDGLMPEVREHEPRLALDGTEDGLEFYRRITEQSVEYINENGWLCYEIGCEQGDDVRNIMLENGYKDVKVIKDLAGLDRVVLGRNFTDVKFR